MYQFSRASPSWWRRGTTWMICWGTRSTVWPNWSSWPRPQSSRRSRRVWPGWRSRSWTGCGHSATPRRGWPGILRGSISAVFWTNLSSALHAGRAPGSSGGAGLTLSTIDAAKGLRWPIVCILDVSDQTTPGRSGPCSDTRPEQRLFYIGVTRATVRLYLYSLTDTGRGSGSRPSRFLDPVLGQLDHGAGPETGGGMTASIPGDMGQAGGGKAACPGRDFCRNQYGCTAYDGIDYYLWLYLWT